MLDPKVSELARKMIEVQFDKRSEQLRRDILRVTNEMAIKGVTDSTMTLSQYYNLYTDEIGIRVNIVWEELKNILPAMELHPSEDLASYLKKEIEKYLSTIIADFNDDWRKRTTQIQSLAYFEQWDNFNSAYDQALKRANAEIDLFVHSLGRTKGKGQSDFPQNVYNFNAPVVAVQTGQGSTANVTQIISSDDKEALLQALDDIKKYLESGGNLSGFSKEEVLELAEESRAEVEKRNPNSSRLKTYLIGIAISIQTAAGLKPAYEVIKLVLSHFHIFLP